MKKLIILFISVLFLSSCGNNRVIKIGFIASISSSQSQLAVDARNSLEILIQEVNENGGINGKQVELVVKDDKDDPAIASIMHSEFIDEGVSLVVGHLTSNMIDVMIQNQSEELLFVSPSVSTKKGSELDDFIFTAYASNDYQAKTVVEYLSTKDTNNLTIVYDEINLEFTENLFIYLKAEYEKTGRTIGEVITIDSSKDDFQEIADEIAEKAFEEVFFITPATTTATLIQYISKQRQDIDFYGASWSMSSDFIQHGGRAVEGVKLIGINQTLTDLSQYQAFEEEYISRYDHKPSIFAIVSYDALSILLEVIEQENSTDPKVIKEGLINIEGFEGLLDSLSFNEYGDSSRTYKLYIVKDGNYEVFNYEK